MSIDFKKVFGSVKDTAKKTAAIIAEKNRNAAKVSKIQSGLKKLEAEASQQYVTLGRYYYSTLRDKENKATEIHCAEIDRLSGEIDALVKELDDHYEGLAAAKAARMNVESEKITLDDVVEYDSRPLIEIKSKDEIVQSVKDLGEKLETGFGKAVTAGKDTASRVKDIALEKKDDIIAGAEKARDTVTEKASQGVKKAANVVSEKAKSVSDSAQKNIENVGRKVADGVENAAKTASEKIEVAADAVSEKASEAAAAVDENDSLPFE